MTQKGYEFLKTFSSLFPRNKITVISSTDINIKDDYYEKIKKFCLKENITFEDKNKFKDDFCEYKIAVSWKWLINNNKNLIVLHDSLLPKYRGFNPLVSALINGDKLIGVTALHAASHYDSGNIIKISKTKINYPITIQEAINKICINYKTLAEYLAKCIIDTKLPVGNPQDEKKASYSLWRDEKDYRIDWVKDSFYLKRFIDAVGNPYAGAITYAENKLVKILDVEPLEDLKIINREPGKIIFIEENKPIVVCGKGLLKINSIKYENGTNFLPIKKFRIRFT